MLRRKGFVRLHMVIAGLLWCAPVVFAQFGSVGGGGGHVGPNTSGGVDEKDQLKAFHQAIALQATSEQSVEFRALVKSTDAASHELEMLRKDIEAGSDASALSKRTGLLREAIDKARTESRKFLDGFSPAQKSGLKEIAGRLLRAESELAEQEKSQEANGADAKVSEARNTAVQPGLAKGLANFRREEDNLGVEMGVLQSEGGQDVAFKIAPLKSSVTIASLPVEITSSAVISRAGTEGGENIFKVVTTSDLSDLQQNMREILAAGIDKRERCGERIQVEDASLVPARPASTVVARLHYQRWVCAHAGGTEMSNEVAEGRATVELRLTGGVGPRGELQIVPEIKEVKAERFLADLLRSGALGDALRERVASAMLSAIMESKAALPASVKDSVRASEARFESSPGLNLGLVAKVHVVAYSLECRDLLTSFCER